MDLDELPEAVGAHFDMHVSGEQASFTEKL